MSQPSHLDSSTDFDPLAAFEQEIAEAATEVPESVPAPRAVAPPPPAPKPNRMELAEAEIVKLRSEVAILVRVISDISAQLRRADQHHATPTVGLHRETAAGLHRETAALAVKFPVLPWKSVGAAIAGVIAGLALGITAWRLMTTISVPEPPPIAAEPAPEAPPEAPPQTMSSLPPPAPAPAPAPVKAAAVIPIRDDPPPRTEPRRYVGSLSIDASPGGEVFVDRQHAGQTPLRLDNLRAGSHLIWIERDGYRRWTRVVQVPADQISRVFADLESNAPR
jgi:hypothetical protein